MVEIEVFGGGIFGLSVAFACLKRGANVRLIEKRTIGAGASGGVVGALAPHTPDNWNAKKQFQFESLIASQGFWAEVGGLSGVSSGYGRTGRLVAVPDKRQLELARMRVTSAQKFWHGLAQWSVVRAGDFTGLAPDSPTGYLTFDTLSARISPRDACTSLAGAFRALGGEILLGETKGRGGDATVLCTGYEGIKTLSEELGQPIGKGVKGQGLLLEHDARNRPQVFAEGVHFIPHQNGTVAVGSTSEIDWEGPGQTDEKLADLHARAVDICPVLHGATVLHRWAGVRPRARRRAPILGQHPLYDHVFIANGGFKIGFGMAVKVGEVMADLVLNGHADIPESFTIAANMKGG